MAGVISSQIIDDNFEDKDKRKMDKFILLSMKRTGSNHLMNSLAMASHKKFVWFDAPPDTWKTFDLPFSKDIWDYNYFISFILITH